MYGVAAFVSRHLPLPFSYWLGLRLADLFHALDRRGRAGVTSNLSRILAHRGIEPAPGSLPGMVRKTYQYFGKYLVDFFRYSSAFCEEIEGKVSIENLSHIESAVQRGRGAIVVTAHVGNWELGGMMLARLGHPVTAVYRPFGIRHLDRMFTDRRQSRGIRLIPLGRAVPGLLRSLRSGGVVSLLADRDFTGRGQPCPFFGAPARLPMGAAILSIKTGAPIVPAFMLRQVDDRFLLKFHPPILPRAGCTVDELQSQVVSSMQDVIGEYPYQWFIFHDFWDTGDCRRSGGDVAGSGEA